MTERDDLYEQGNIGLCNAMEPKTAERCVLTPHSADQKHSWEPKETPVFRDLNGPAKGDRYAGPDGKGL